MVVVVVPPVVVVVAAAVVVVPAPPVVVVVVVVVVVAWHGPPQSCGQVIQFSPGSQVPLPQQLGVGRHGEQKHPRPEQVLI